MRKAVLRDIQNCPTVDIGSLLWAGFLRRCITKKEILLPMYLFQNYCEELHVQDFHTMNVIPNNPELTAKLFFLSWTAGFAVFPGSNSGSLGGEAAHSPWQAELRRLGGKWELEDAVRFMQTLYREKWGSAYEWDTGAAELNLLPPERDLNLLNGTLLASLGRSTMHDFCERAKEEGIAHNIPLGNNFFVVLPATVQGALPSLDAARLGCRMLLAAGVELQTLLLEAGILQSISEEEEKSFGLTCLCERDRRQGSRLAEFHRFRTARGISEDFQCKEPLLSLSAYRRYFVNVAYVLRDHPSGSSDSWPYLRCTCLAFSQHAPCEHVEYARTLHIPNMRDHPNSAEDIPCSRKRGRVKGMLVTARSKAAARAKASGLL